MGVFSHLLCMNTRTKGKQRKPEMLEPIYTHFPSRHPPNVTMQTISVHNPLIVKYAVFAQRYSYTKPNLAREAI